MKEKKSKGLRKALLMAVATALVIAISVSATLAFLTDSTAQRDNVFMGASNGIRGSIKEPSFDANKTWYYSPGKETLKDPMVQNDSLDDPIYVGVAVSFEIKTQKTGSFVPVSYEVFKKYVTIKYGAGEFNTSDWQDVSGFTGADANKKYFIYKSSLTKTDGVNAVAIEANNGNDTTKALFSSVKMSEFIHIPEVADSSKKVAATLKPAQNPVAGTIYIDDAANNLTRTNQYLQDFEICDFKISISGYGTKTVKDDNTAKDFTNDVIPELEGLFVNGIQNS